jgi:uncharacterized protein YcbK (DUF882 family)
MRIFHRRSVAATVAVATAVFGLSVGARAGDLRSAARSSSSSAVSAAGVGSSVMGEQYHLRMHHLHTGESIDVVYRVGNTYLPAALAKLNFFLRDHRTQAESDYDPKEFDLLHELMVKLNKPNGVINIVCGYRTPWSNSYLRHGSASSGVAQHSQHMLAKAIDIRVPGVSTVALRDAALSLHEGGVGYYPVSQFVHVDVGPVRRWSFGAGGD